MKVEFMPMILHGIAGVISYKFSFNIHRFLHCFSKM